MSEIADQEIGAARRMAAISIVVNLLLAVVKGVVGVLSGSTALVGDAINSGADVFTSSAAFVGLWVAGRKHPAFPYGLYKAETVATLISAIVVILAGYEIGRQALLGDISRPDLGLALPVTIACFFISLSFGLIQLRASRRLNSLALEADARDYLADSLSTGVVLLGLLASFWGWELERWATAGVSLFVLRVGVHLLTSALRDLLDASIDRETEMQIRQLVEVCPRVSRIKRFLSRTTGGRYMVDMDVVLATPSHQVADEVADRLEEDIVRQFPRVVMARVRPHFAQAPGERSSSPLAMYDKL
ncbi:MAG: cation diffusion facilitator family transporter [Thermodesulfobacteriota bacterium]